MKDSKFLKGMSLGMALGAAAGSMMPKKRCKKRSAAAKALRSVTDALEAMDL